jgi:hypothetical protein
MRGLSKIPLRRPVKIIDRWPIRGHAPSNGGLAKAVRLLGDNLTLNSVLITLTR